MRPPGQQWRMGRVSHTVLQPDHAAPVSSSAIQAQGVKVFVDIEGRGPENGIGEMVQRSMPGALRGEEIAVIVAQYAQVARNAMEAGFDGVELHGANGYLINQFIDSRENQRDDEYGGSLSSPAFFTRSRRSRRGGHWQREGWDPSRAIEPYR